MNDRNKIDPASLPALADLHKASGVIGVLFALVALVAVLPAEFGIDPTGLGTLLGLTALGELKHSSEASEPAPEPEPEPEASAPLRSDKTTLTLAPEESTEVKAVMRLGTTLTYSWKADGGEVFYDFHGEPKGAAANVFTSFEKGTASAAEGEFEAPFEGVHGWYWKNVGPETVTLHLETSGQYSSIKRLP